MPLTRLGTQREPHFLYLSHSSKLRLSKMNFGILPVLSVVAVAAAYDVVDSYIFKDGDQIYNYEYLGQTYVIVVNDN